MSDELLLLGLLSGSAMHGYQLNEVIENHLPMLWDLKPSTAYSRLDRLASRGLVQTTTARVGRRPERKVYELTTVGRERFMELLRENMRTAHTDSRSADLGILFSRALPSDEVAELLRERREATASRRPHLLEMLDRHPSESAGYRISERALAHLDVELQWLDGVLASDAPVGSGATAP
jgi:DNA-binding PadR family transcriptional regulator